MFVRSAALNEGIRLRASLFALGVRRAQTGVKVRVVEEAMEVLGEVWGKEDMNSVLVFGADTCMCINLQNS